MLDTALEASFFRRAMQHLCEVLQEEKEIMVHVISATIGIFVGMLIAGIRRPIYVQRQQPQALPAPQILLLQPPTPGGALQPAQVIPAQSTGIRPWYWVASGALAGLVVLFALAWIISDPSRDLDAVQQMAGPTVARQELSRNILERSDGSREITVEFHRDSRFHGLNDRTELAWFRVGSGWEVEANTVYGPKVYRPGEEFRTDSAVARRTGGMVLWLQQLLRR